MMIGDKLVKAFQVKDKPMVTIFFRSDKNIGHYFVAIMTGGLNDTFMAYKIIGREQVASYSRVWR